MSKCKKTLVMNIPLALKSLFKDRELKQENGSVERVRKFWDCQMIPTFADFADLKLLFDYPGFEDDNSKEVPKNKHIFWDGGYLSNTPLREVIHAHRDYWLDSKSEVPDLEVYIADTWPTTMKEEPVSLDNDFIEDRRYDLIFGDKTEYDEKVADIVTDYIDLTNKLIRFAKVNGLPQDGIDRILSKRANKSKSRTGEPRQYADLMNGRFGLTKVLRIQLEDDGNTISTKYYDYSTKTISHWG